MKKFLAIILSVIILFVMVVNPASAGGLAW